MSENTLKEVRLVVPDSSVLISLAHGDVLWLLKRVAENVQLCITDVVEYEVTGNQWLSDAKKITQFLEDNRDIVSIEKTGFGDLIEAKRKNSSIPIPKDMGELSIYGLINSIRSDAPGVPTLVLFEDNWFMKNQTRPSMVHLLSLSAFLKYAEEVIEGFSYQDAVAAITRTRPLVNLIEFDSPGENPLESTQTDSSPVRRSLKGPGL